MASKQLLALCLFSVREAGKGFIISLRASNRYAPSYLEALERSLSFLARFSETNDWPQCDQITTAHIESYLVSLQTRTRWFGERDSKNARPVSQSYIETQYRRLRRFFGWMVERGHIEANPFNLIPHPKIDEKVIQTVSEKEMLQLVDAVDPAGATTPGELFRRTRDRAVLFLLWDTPARREELTGLTVDTVDLDAGAILVLGKGGRERWMPMGGGLFRCPVGLRPDPQGLRPG